MLFIVVYYNIMLYDMHAAVVAVIIYKQRQVSFKNILPYVSLRTRLFEQITRRTHAIIVKRKKM